MSLLGWNLSLGICNFFSFLSCPSHLFSSHMMLNYGNTLCIENLVIVISESWSWNIRLGDCSNVTTDRHVRIQSTILCIQQPRHLFIVVNMCRKRIALILFTCSALKGLWPQGGCKGDTSCKVDGR
jgi:hypothetical protein